MPHDDEVMFIGRKVASKTPKMRKGAMSLQSKQNQGMRRTLKSSMVNGQSKQVVMRGAVNPSFSRRHQKLNASTETPMEVYLRSVDGIPSSKLSEAAERNFTRKPQTSEHMTRVRLRTNFGEAKMQTLPTYPRSTRTGGPSAEARQRAHQQILESRQRGSEMDCADCRDPDKGKRQADRAYQQMRKETLTAADMLRSGYNHNRGNFNVGKFKVYGKNSAAQEFNTIAQENQKKGKYQPKINDWSLQQDLKKLKADNSRSATPNAEK